MGELVSDLLVELIGGGLVVVLAAGLGGIGYLIARADRKQEARMTRIYDRLDALEQRAADHDLKTASIEAKVDLLMVDHRKLLGDDDEPD